MKVILIIHFLMIAVFFSACTEDEQTVYIDAGLLVHLTTAIYPQYLNQRWSDGDPITQEEQARIDQKLNEVLNLGTEVYCDRSPTDVYALPNDTKCYVKLKKKGQTTVIPRFLKYTAESGEKPITFTGVANLEIMNWLFFHNSNHQLQNFAFANIMLVEQIKNCEYEKYNFQAEDPHQDEYYLGCTRQAYGGSLISKKGLEKGHAPIAHEVGHLLIDSQKMPNDPNTKKKYDNHLPCKGSFTLNQHLYDAQEDFLMSSCRRSPVYPIDNVILPEICDLIIHPYKDAFSIISRAGGEVEERPNNYEALCNP